MPLVAVACLVTLHILNQRSTEQFYSKKGLEKFENTDEAQEVDESLEADMMDDPTDMALDSMMPDLENVEDVDESENVEESDEMVEDSPETFSGKYNVKPAYNLSGNQVVCMPQ